MALQERKDHFLKVYGGLATGSLGAGISSFFFNPLFIISIGAIISGFGSLKYYFFPSDEEEQKFSRQYKKFFWIALAGIVLAMIRIILGVLQLTKILTS